MQVRPYRDLDNVIDGAVVTFVDISERKRHEQTRSLLAAIVEGSQDAIVSHDLQGTITSWNAGAEQLYGYPRSEAIGRSVTMLGAEALADEWPDVLARLEHGERIAQFDSAKIAKNGRAIEVSVTISPVREGEGGIVGASLVARDISERKAADRKTVLLLGELDHRVKNILAIVSAVVSQTLKTNSAPEVFAAEIDGRIKAIANAHSLLTRTGQGEMSLRAIFAAELAPYDRGDGSIVVTGRDIALTPKAGLPLAMAVHELASNAAKYGALSAPAGRLEVRWQVTGGGAGERALTLTWMEAGGPPVQLPPRRGFGTTLIERTLAHELDADVRREFLETGLRCTLAIPLTEEVGRMREASPRKPWASVMTSDSLAGCRILVVEDEMLIAVLIEQILEELGCVVVGPVARLDAALRLASQEALDAAILDVAIRGGHVQPVAEQLLARGIPFVLASGYGDWSLPENLRNQPRLTKPFTQVDLEQHVKLLCARRP